MCDFSCFPVKSNFPLTDEPKETPHEHITKIIQKQKKQNQKKLNHFGLAVLNFI